MEKNALEISWSTLWRILFFVTFVAIMFMGRGILLGLFLAIVISSGLEFIVTFLEKRGLPRTLGVIVIFLSFAVLVVMMAYTLVPLMVIDLNSAFAKLAKFDNRSLFGPLLSFRTTQSIAEFINKISTDFLSGSGSAFGAFSGVVGGLMLGISILVSSFYLSITKNGVERFILAVIPHQYESEVLHVYERATRKIGFWFRSQLLLSVLMAGLVLVTLLILGVRYAFLIALLTGIFELLPYIGPIISGAVAVLAAFVTSVELASYTLVAFVVLHQVENHILVPLLIGRNVGLHPVIVIIALLIGAEVGGFLGILISVPAAVVFQEVIEYWSDQKKTRRMSAMV